MYTVLPDGMTQALLGLAHAVLDGVLVQGEALGGGLVAPVFLEEDPQRVAEPGDSCAAAGARTFSRSMSCWMTCSTVAMFSPTLASSSARIRLSPLSSGISWTIRSYTSADNSGTLSRGAPSSTGRSSRSLDQAWFRQHRSATRTPEAHKFSRIHDAASVVQVAVSPAPSAKPRLCGPWANTWTACGTPWAASAAAKR